ncbi:hypothetical protein BU15DRAFT_52081 [Melanogaster broomeanus]|nr:hypothetical protein BU15DRAFT_52081 [Melanogaster broomeanus]
MPPKASGKANPSSKQPNHPSTNHPKHKQPVSLDERLKRLFTSLCAQIDGGHFTNAIKTCNKILRLDPADSDALQTKLFLLLQTEQYDAALSLLGGATSGDGPDHTFEEAYAMYRLHREENAATSLARIKETHRGVLHLEAQLSYRHGSYQSSLDLYNELLETADPQSEEYSDVLTNLTASQKHLDFLNMGSLRALHALPSSITSTIETSPPPSVQPTVSLAFTSAALIQQTADESVVANKVKKVRMKRVPKGVIPGVTPAPDPERWLKKSERSSIGQSGRKRRGGGGGATQGVVTENTPAQGHSGKSTGGGGPSHSKGKKKK